MTPKRPIKRTDKSKSVNRNLDMSYSPFSALVEGVMSPNPIKPHRRTSAHEEDDSQLPVVSNDQSNYDGLQEEFYGDLIDSNGPIAKRKPRRVRRGVHRAFSDSSLASEASSINSQLEIKKKLKAHKSSWLQKRKDRVARKLLGKGKLNHGPDDQDEADNKDEDEDVDDTDKDLQGFTGIALKKKSAHSTHRTEDLETDVVIRKTRAEVDLETRSRVSKSPARFPKSRGRGRRASLGEWNSTHSSGRSSRRGVSLGDVEKFKKKKKKKRPVSRTKRLSNRKFSDSESGDSSSGEDQEKVRSSSKSKSPAPRKKSAGARKAKRIGRKKNCHRSNIIQ